MRREKTWGWEEGQNRGKELWSVRLSFNEGVPRKLRDSGTPVGVHLERVYGLQRKIWGVSGLVSYTSSDQAMGTNKVRREVYAEPPNSRMIESKSLGQVRQR